MQLKDPKGSGQPRTSPRSTAKRMFDNTRKTAVSVEWPSWSKSAVVGWQQVGGLQVVHEPRTKRRSRSFDSTDRFEIGRYDETAPAVVSMPGLFTVGVMNAFLKPAGK